MGSFSALSGGVALGLMMLPVIITADRADPKAYSGKLKRSILALGVSIQDNSEVILPAGVSGIMTGILLSIARLPVRQRSSLYVLRSPFMNLNVLKPINSLPLMIFNYATKSLSRMAHARLGSFLY